MNVKVQMHNVCRLLSVDIHPRSHSLNYTAYTKLETLQGIASICHSYTPVYLYKKFFLHYIHGSWIGIVT